MNWVLRFEMPTHGFLKAFILELHFKTKICRMSTAPFYTLREADALVALSSYKMTDAMMLNKETQKTDLQTGEFQYDYMLL
jgi:hypothetical protein